MRNAVIMVEHRLGKFVLDETPEILAERVRAWREAYSLLFPEDTLAIQLMHSPHKNAWLQANCGVEPMWHLTNWSYSCGCDPWVEDNTETGQFDPEAEFQRWLAHTEPAKRNRYLAAWTRAAQSPLIEHSKEVLQVDIGPKCDEVLLKYAMTEADNGWVPRPIHQVDPLFAVTLGPEVYRVTERIKRLWRSYRVPQLKIGGLDVHVTFGAGLTDADLSHWFNSAVEEVGMHIICAGDDSVIAVLYPDGWLTFWEGDASQFDHSIRLAALEFEWKVLKRMGLSKNTIKLLKRNSSAQCTTRPRADQSVSIRVIRSEERNTGGVDTTVGNTCNMTGLLVGSMSRVHYTRHTTVAAMEVECQRFGMIMKFKKTEGRVAELGGSWFPPSFLKGTWWKGPGPQRNFLWGPLLSRLLKISKTMSDPMITYRHHRPASLRDALELHAIAVAKSMSSYTWPEPLIKWMSSFLRSPLAGEVRPSHEDIRAPWKPLGTLGQGVLDWQEQAADWYGVSADEVVEFVRHVCQLRVGDFSFHPMWRIMALRDYN